MTPRLLLALPLLALLAACNDPEEEAARFFASGLELREEGDLDRAAIEFRNVFRHDGAHLEARRNLAEILVEKGEIANGYGQYLRLAEQYPDDVSVREAMARIAIEQRQWDEAERHGRPVIAAAPDSLGARVIRAGLDYREAVMAGDDPERRARVVEEARAILEEAPDEIIPRQIVLAEALEAGDTETALADVERAIALRPGSLDYAMLKLQILVGLDDRPAIEAHLRAMAERFPDDASVQRTLVAWYLENRDFDAAEAYLRELAGPETGETGGHVTVVRLVEQTRGREAAIAEVERLIEANAEAPANRLFFQALLASYRFDGGEADAAATLLQSAIEEAEGGEGGTEGTLATELRRAKGVLARVLLANGNAVGARALVEEVLAEDSADVTALRLRGAMLIEDDRPDEAIVDLRRALSQAPRDTDIILLLAEAHGRNGNRQLMGERLATAVEVSDSAPREALRYVDYLLAEGRTGAARTVLAEARESNPGNVEILARQGQLALQEDALPTVRSVIAGLEALAGAGEADGADGADGAETPVVAAEGAPAPGAEARAERAEAAGRAARALRAALLLREERREEGLAMLAEQAGEAGDDARSVLALVRARMAAGETEAARRYLDELRAASPEDGDLALIDAALTASEGDTAGSEAMLRTMLEADPGAEGAARMLHRQLLTQGRGEEATAVLDAAIEANPESRALQLIKAGEAERVGDYEEAVELYEALYAQNSSDVIVANNLASVLTVYRDDPESLERAAAVAQRLRGTDVAPFQDTYGWIASRRGNHAEALDYLEPAARGLPSNPLVQFHLGMTYRAVDRNEEAAAALGRALDLAAGRDLAQFDTARAVLAEIEAEASPGTGAEEAPETDAPEAEDADAPAAADR